MTFLGVAVAFIIMGFRVSALYGGNISVIVFLGVIYIAVFGTSVWLLSSGEPEPHGPEIPGCTMIFGPKIKNSWGSLWAWMPLAYDTVVVVLVLRLLRIRALRTHKWGRGRLVSALITDGLLYYSVICAANLTLGIMIHTAPLEVKFIAAQFQGVITVVMMSRITLNVREHMVVDPRYPSFLDTPNISSEIDTPLNDISMQRQIPIVPSLGRRPTFGDPLLQKDV